MNTPVFRSFSDGTISVCSTDPNTQVGSSHLLNEGSYSEYNFQYYPSFPSKFISPARHVSFADEPAAKMRRLSQVSPKISHGKRISSTSRVTRPRTYSRVSQAEHVMNEGKSCWNSFLIVQINGIFEMLHFCNSRKLNDVLFHELLFFVQIK